MPDCRQSRKSRPPSRSLGAHVAKSLVIVESPAKAKTIAGFLGSDFTVKASVGHIRDLPRAARSEVPDDKKETHGRLAGIDPDDHFDAVYVVHDGEEEGRRRSEGGPEGRRRAHPRDGRGSRGRGDRLARARGVEAEGAGAAHGVPRDHAARDPRGARPSARARHEARRGAGGPPHARPARRLGDVAGAVARVRPRPGRVGRTRAERRGAPRRGARARPHGVPHRSVERSRRRALRARPGASAPRSSSSTAAASPKGHDFDPATGQLAAARTAARRCRAARRGRGRRARRPAAATRRSRSRRWSPSRSPSSRAAPFTTSTLQQESGRKLRYGAARTMSIAQRLYERGLHHLYANRQHEPVGAGDHRGPTRDPRAVRRGVPARRAAHLPQQGEERAGGARGDPARRRSHPHARGSARRARRRRAAALRVDLDPHDRVPDGRRARQQDDAPHRRDLDRRTSARCSAPRARRTTSSASDACTSKTSTRARSTRTKRACPAVVEGERVACNELVAGRATRRSRPRATPRRAS